MPATGDIPLTMGPGPTCPASEGGGAKRGFVRGAPVVLVLAASGLAGCAEIPLGGLIRTQTAFHGNAHFDGRVSASMETPIRVEIPPAIDPGPMVAVPVRAGNPGARVGIIDVDGLILNQNVTGLYSVGENPVSAFREKLEAAAAAPNIRAVVVRINSPGGSVTASDILAEELRRFRESSGKPVVACLMDLATSGAYYVAVGADRVVAHPTTVTGGVGALINHYNLQDASAQLNARAGAVKSGPLVDMGSVTAPLPDDAAKLLQEMVDGFGDRFRGRITSRRPSMTAADRADGPRRAGRRCVQGLGFAYDRSDRICGRRDRRGWPARRGDRGRGGDLPAQGLSGTLDLRDHAGPGRRPVRAPEPAGARPGQAPDVPLPLAARPDPPKDGRTLRTSDPEG